MKQDNWTEHLRRKLADHEALPPADLWTDIEAALPAAPRRGTPRKVALRRLSVAAALAAVLAGGVAIWWPQYQKSNAPASKAEAQGGTHSAAASEPLLADADVRQKETPAQQSTVTAQQSAVTAPVISYLTNSQTEPTPDVAVSNDGETCPDEPGISPASQDKTSENGSAGKEQQPQAAANQAPPTPERFRQRKSETPSVSRPRNAGRLSLSLYAGNGLGESRASNGVLMARNLANDYAATLSQASSRQSMIFLSGYEEQQHHSQPLSLGLSLSYPLSPRLSLVSGVVFSRLRSEFTWRLRSQQYVREQTLHYVGVPLGLSYRLWQGGGLQVYVSAAVEADWNVGARSETEGVSQHLDHDRTQWSTVGAVGLQYHLLPQLSLYAEPGVSHYFANGSSMQNFFKDKPTSLKLQAGLRFSLK